MKKILFVYGGPDYHPGYREAETLKKLMDGDGRFCVESTTDLDAFLKLKSGDYATVVVATTGFAEELKGPREDALLGFIKGGGGFVGVHCAADSFRGSRAYVDMIGGEFRTHPEFGDMNVKVVDNGHYITTRIKDFTIPDEMYILDSHDPSKVHLLLETSFKGEKFPLAYTKEYGEGRVFYLALGHNSTPWKNFEFQKLLVRGIAWTTGEEKTNKTIRCGVLGYGPSYRMGKDHAEWVTMTEGLELVAICDKDPKMAVVAEKEFPGLKGYFTDADEMLKMNDLDLVTVVTPHNVHAPLALKCLDAGKSVIVEKPMCITAAEATAMINKAREKDLMLSVFQNRRWDNDFICIKNILSRWLIGDIFHIECRIGGYGKPGDVWRSNKEISGGILYDIGAHRLDQILQLIPSKITHVMGNFQKRVWDMFTNEDHAQCYVKFEDGTVVDLIMSNMWATGGPDWRIMGTKGSFENGHDEGYKVVSYTSDIKMEYTIPTWETGYDWWHYYRNIADHMLLGEELIVKPEQSRRVIGIFDAAEQSAKLGHSIPPLPECE